MFGKNIFCPSLDLTITLHPHFSPDAVCHVTKCILACTVCAGNCTPGQYIAMGGINCNLCDYGLYQPYWWQSQCLKCPQDRTTQRLGAISLSECIREYSCRVVLFNLSNYWLPFYTPGLVVGSCHHQRVSDRVTERVSDCY